MKKRVAIVAGGDSGEYEVSINSGRVVLKHLDRNKYDPMLLYMKNREWFYLDEEGKRYPVDKNDFSLDLPSGKVRFDVVFIAIHGTPGEDGKLQGYFELLGIPYTGCGHTTSSLAFNKFLNLHTVRSTGLVLVAPSLLIKKTKREHIDKLTEQIRIPCFVKPNEGGSSVGTTRVDSREKLLPAIERALQEDDEVLVEELIPGREITCGIIRRGGEAVALPITEIVTRNEFFDYEAKYHGAAEEITPAPIPVETARKASGISLMLYELMNCRGIVRFDYIFNDTGIYYLEMNTIPGLSEASIVPQQAEAAGISLSELFSLAIEDALRS